MRLVPVQFGSNSSNLPPPTTPVELLKSTPLPDGTAARDGFDFPERSDDLEVHIVILARSVTVNYAMSSGAWAARVGREFNPRPSTREGALAFADDLFGDFGLAFVDKERLESIQEFRWRLDRVTAQLGEQCVCADRVPFGQVGCRCSRIRAFRPTESTARPARNARREGPCTQGAASCLRR